MTCREVDDLRSRGGPSWSRALPEEVREHLRTCEQCRRLQQHWDAPISDRSVPSELQSRITRQIVGTLRPVSPLPSLGVLTTLLLLIAGIAIAMEAWWVGQDGWHALSPWQAAGIFLPLGGGLLVMARSLVNQMIPGSRQWLSPMMAVSLISATLLVASVLFFPYHHDEQFFTRGLRCWGIGCSCSVVSALLLSVVLRRSARLSPIRLGTATGFLAGLVGMTVLEIFCPFLEREHIGVWHFGSVLTSIFLGFLIGTAATRLPANSEWKLS